METLMKCKNVFKWMSFGILTIAVSTTLIALVWQALNSDNKITDKIYDINSFLCVISILSACAYGTALYLLKPNDTYNYSKKKKNVKKKIDLKAIIKKTWPCILLVVFLGWTAVGCIQASMEAAAEAALMDDISSNDTQRNKEIAAWTSGDRMKNAADRSWNGCENLKDGYFSFLFYAMVAVNVILLGPKSDKLKKILLRILMISGILLVVFSFLSIFEPFFMGGLVKYNRAIFNNSNHYGYFLCIITVLSAMFFIKEKNIYFKVIALFGYILSTFMLIANNTFGAYLGVMVAVAVIMISGLIKFIIECLKEKKITLANWQDVICTILVTLVFSFFSCTITNVASEYKADTNKRYIDSKIVFTFGKYDNALTIAQDKSSAIIVASNFEDSGDTRIFTSNEKKLQLVNNETDYDPENQYYRLRGNIYKIISDETETKVKLPGEYANKTIVKGNFEQLSKDLKTIFGFFGKDNSEESKDSNDNDVESVISGEASESKDEEVNEKSGLSLDVSSTGSGRGEVWITSFKLMAQRPVFGWGLENLLNEFYYQYGINEGRTHNLILQLAGTTGIFGMLFYMTAVVAIFFKVLARYKNWGMIEYVIVPVFIAYMTSSMFGNSAFYTSPYFILILGMMIATTLFKGKEQDVNEKDYISDTNKDK